MTGIDPTHRLHHRRLTKETYFTFGALCTAGCVGDAARQNYRTHTANGPSLELSASSVARMVQLRPRFSEWPLNSGGLKLRTQSLPDKVTL